MSNSVDQRIVEMQFDNAQFERGVANTLASLKNLESGLSTIGSVSGLSKVKDAADSVNFDAATASAAGFSDVLENLKGVASNVFGHIVSGVGTVAKALGIVDAIAHTGVAALAITGGWNRASAINQAEFKLQGLLKDSEKVELAMKNASDAVNGTAYGLDSAVTAAANLVASGVNLGTEMEEVLVTIADLAGTSGRDFDSVAQIMGAVAAQGKLSGMQIQQFSLSGLNVTAALAKNLHKTEAEIKSMTSKGQIDFETFARVMKEEFGGNAKNANNTFEGSLANVRAALSRTTADLFQYGQKAMVPVFNGLRESINAVNWALKPLMGTWTDAEGKLQKGVLIKGFEKVTKGIGEALHQWGGTLSKEGTGNFLIDELTGKPSSSSYISRGPLRFRRIFQEVADALKAPMDEIGKGSKDLTFAIIEMGAGFREVLRLAGELISPIGMAFNDIFGNNTFAKFANTFRHDFVEPILESLAGFRASEGYVNIVRTAFQVLFSVIDAGLKIVVPFLGSSFKFIFDLISSLGLALGAFLDIVSGIVQIGADAGSSMSSIFDPMKEILANSGLGAIVDFFENLAHGVKLIVNAVSKNNENAFGNLADFLKSIKTIGVNTIKKFGTILENLGGRIKGFFQNVKDGVSGWLEDNRGNAETIFKFFGNIADGIGNAINTIFSSWDFSSFQTPRILSDLATSVKTFWDSLSGNEEAAASFENWKRSLSEDLSGPLGKLSDAFRNFGKALSDFGKDFRESAIEKAQWITEQFGKIGDRLSPVVESIRQKVSNIWTTIKDAFVNANLDLEPVRRFIDDIAGTLKNLVEKIIDGDFKFTDIFTIFKDLGGSIGNLGADLAPKFASALGDIGQAIYSNLEGPLKDLADWVLNVTNPLDSLSNNFSNNIDKISSGFSNFRFPWQKEPISKGSTFEELAGVDADEIVDEGFDFLTALDNLVNFFKSPIGALQSWAKGAFDNIGNIGKVINDFVDSLDWTKIDKFVSKIVSLGVGAGSVAALFELAQFLKSATGLLDSIKDIGDALKGVVNKLGGIADAAKQNLKTQALMNIAIAIAILVGVLIALSLSDLDKAWKALPIILILLVGVSAIVAAFGRLSSSNSFNVDGIATFSRSLLSISIAIGIMALLTECLGKMPPEVLKQGRTTLIQFALIFAGFAYLSSKVPKDSSSLAKAFISLSVAFGILGLVAAIIGSWPKESMDRGLGILTGMAVGIAMLLSIMGAIDANNVKKSAQGFLEIAGAVVILALAAAVLGHLEVYQLVKGVGAVAVLLLVVSGVIVAFQKLKVYAIAKATASILFLSLAVGMLAASVAGLALLSSITDIGGGVGAIVALMMSLAVLAAVLGNSKRSLDSSVFGLIALASVIAVLAVTLAGLSLLDSDDLGMALVRLSEALLVFVVATYALGEISKKLPGTMAILGELAVVIAVIAVALTALSMVAKYGDLTAGMIALAVGIGVLVAALLVLSFIAPGLEVVALAFMGFGAAVVLLGLGVLELAVSAAIFVSAMQTMANVGPEAADALVECVKRIGRGLWDAKGDIELGIMGVGYGIISGIMGLIPMALLAIAEFFKQLLAVIIELSPELGYGGIAVVSGLISGIARGLEEHGGDIIDAILSLGEVVVNGVMGIFDTAKEGFDSWLFDVTGGLIGAKPEIQEAAQEVTEAASQGADDGNTMDEDFGGKLDKMLEETHGRIGDFGLEGENLIGGFIQSADDEASGFDITKTLGIDPETFGGSMADVQKLTKENGMELPSGLTEGMSEGFASSSPLSSIMSESGYIDSDGLGSLFAGYGGENADAYSGGLDEGLRSYDPTPLMTGQATMSQEAVGEQFGEAGRTAASSFNDSFAETLTIDGSGPTMKAAEAMKLPEKFSQAGKANGEAAVKGLQDGTKNLAEAAKKAGNAAIKEFTNKNRSAKSGGTELGRNLSAGVAQGLQSEWPSVERTCNKIINKIDEVLRKKAKVKSPSRMTAEIGRYMVEGLVVGMEQMQGNLVKTAEETMEGSLTAMSTRASYISKLLEDIDEQPVIRPILDLTAYNAGLAQMSGFDTVKTMTFAQAAGNRMFSMPSPSDKLVQQTNTIHIVLNYDAGADANQMLMDIARGLNNQLAMEGV